MNNIEQNTFGVIVADGYDNRVQAVAHYTVIGGGFANIIETNSSSGVIGGGNQNRIYANATSATIPGGVNNSATNYAFAAGRNAKANHTGSFVWADSQNADFASTTNDQFAIRAQNGVVIQAATNGTALELRTGGVIKVTGAGIGTGTLAFVHRATPANIEVGSTHRTTITHPHCDGNPNAILIITHNYNPGLTGGVLDVNPTSVFYHSGLAKWQIYHDNFAAMAADNAWNVLVFKP